MKGDFSRTTFDPSKHYRRVLMQQGRVQMDADWNEQISINLEHDQNWIRNLIGPYGGPTDGSLDGGGFFLSEASGPLGISAGQYYVDGIWVVNDTDDLPVGAQPFLPDTPLSPSNGDKALFYLEVSERHVTHYEDEAIREKALGGADTGTRGQTVWQVKWEPVAGSVTPPVCVNDLPEWQDVLEEGNGTGRLQARAQEEQVPDSPCIVTPGGGYRRLENQLYRVEVHDPGAAGSATFKWSRENGTVVARWQGINGTNTSEWVVDSVGKDAVLALKPGTWIEVVDEKRQLLGLPGTLVQIDSIEGEVVTINPATATDTIDFNDFDEPLLRRWENREGQTALQTIEVAASNEGYLKLEDGVEVRFDDAASAMYKTGDYWLIPARTATANVEWPDDPNQPGTPDLQLPHGPSRHFAPLAVGEFSGGSWSLQDLRSLFTPVTESIELYYRGGDGQEAMPIAQGPLPAGRLSSPLRVGVSRGGVPLEGARVRFEILSGAGTLENGAISGNTITVVTDSDGKAEAVWTLGINVATPFQEAQATLLDDCGDDHVPIVFSAQLSLASRVHYDDPACANMAGVETVEEGLRLLSRLTILDYVGGDGQEYLPDVWLPQPLEVSVSNKCGPMVGAVVEFQAEGDGLLSPTVADQASANASSLTAQTDAQGIALCYWLPAKQGQDNRQTIARLQDANGLPIQGPAEVHFSSRRRTAGGGAYPPTVGADGDYPSLEAAFSALSGESAINLTLLPGVHVADGLSVETGALKLTGSGSLASIVDIRGQLSLTAGEILLRDIFFGTHLFKETQTTADPQVLLAGERIHARNCRWDRSTSNPEPKPFVTVGSLKEGRETQLIWENNWMSAVAYGLDSGGGETALGPLVFGTAVPSELDAKMEAFLALNPIVAAEDVKGAAEALAVVVVNMAPGDRKEWADGIVAADTDIAADDGAIEERVRGGSGRAVVGAARMITDRLALIESSSEFVFPESSREARLGVAVDNAVLLSGVRGEFAEEIAKGAIEASIVRDRLIAIANARVLTRSDIALALQHTGIGGWIDSNDVNGVISLNHEGSQELTSMLGEITKSTPNLDTQASLRLIDNQLVRVLTRVEMTEGLQPGYESLHVMGNNFQGNRSSFMSETIVFNDNRVEDGDQKRSDQVYVLAVAGVLTGNISTNSAARVNADIVPARAAIGNNIPPNLVS